LRVDILPLQVDDIDIGLLNHEILHSTMTLAVTHGRGWIGTHYMWPFDHENSTRDRAHSEFEYSGLWDRTTTRSHASWTVRFRCHLSKPWFDDARHVMKISNFCFEHTVCRANPADITVATAT